MFTTFYEKCLYIDLTVMFVTKEDVTHRFIIPISLLGIGVENTECCALDT